MSSYRKWPHNHTRTHTHRNTHSSGSTCHIPLSSDNIAAVKVAASVIGRTNHSRGDETVPSRRSESRGGPRQRTSCQSPATEKRGKSLLFCSFPLCINVIYQRPTLLYMAIHRVFICKNGHLGLLQCAYDANPPSGFGFHLVLLPHYLLCSFLAESPLTSISRSSPRVALQSCAANTNVIHRVITPANY